MREAAYEFEIRDARGRRRVQVQLPRQHTGRAATMTARRVLGIAYGAHVKLSAATGQRQQWTRRRQAREGGQA